MLRTKISPEAEPSFTDLNNLIHTISNKWLVADSQSVSNDSESPYTPDELPNVALTCLSNLIKMLRSYNSSKNIALADLLLHIHMVRLNIGIEQLQDEQTPISDILNDNTTILLNHVLRLTATLLSLHQGIKTIKSDPMAVDDDNQKKLPAALETFCERLCDDLFNQLSPYKQLKPYAYADDDNILNLPAFKTANEAVTIITAMNTLITNINAYANEIQNLHQRNYVIALRKLQEDLCNDVSKQLNNRIPTSEILASSTLTIVNETSIKLMTLSNPTATQEQKLQAIQQFENNCKPTPRSGCNNFLRAIATTIFAAVGAVLGACLGGALGFLVGGPGLATLGAVQFSITGAAIGAAAGGVVAGAISGYFLLFNKPKPEKQVQAVVHEANAAFKKRSG